MSLLRKPMKRVQGVKILCYGVDGSGKSVFGLSFPQVAVLDSESKVGVYEGDPEFGKNIVAVADTSNYYDTLDVIEEVIKSNLCKTLMIDSETYIKEGMEAIIYGDGENGTMSIQEASQLAGTNKNEILSRLMERPQRFYINKKSL